MNEPFSCLKFKIPDDVDVEDVHSAHLWVYKRHESLETLTETLEVSDVTHWDKERHFFKAKPIALTNTSTKGKLLTLGLCPNFLLKDFQIDFYRRLGKD